MRHYPEDKEEIKEAKDVIKAEDWQIDLLKKNPNYVFWGCFEDYMSDRDSGWRSSVIIPSWDEFNFPLDELNEVVNFYFDVYRKGEECSHCEGSNLNPQTKQLADDWYDFENTGRRWCDKLEWPEVEALAKEGRLHNFMNQRIIYNEDEDQWYELDNREWEWVKCDKPQLPTPEEVNKKERKKGIGHDAINRHICIQTRAKRLGFYGYCQHCESGIQYIEDFARVGLQLWVIHPRKGCSRGVYVENVKKDQLEEVFQYLQEAANRNAERFKGIMSK